MTLAALLLSHEGDDSRLELLYFWAAVLLALTPVLIFGGIGVVVLRGIWKQRRASSDPAPSLPPAPRGPAAGPDPSERPSA
jgi:hypothetical protein